MSHSTHMDTSCHTYERVTPHIFMGHITHVNQPPEHLADRRKLPALIDARVHESRHTCQWVTAHICISHSTHMNESLHTYSRVMPHIFMRHITHVNQSPEHLEEHRKLLALTDARTHFFFFNSWMMFLLKFSHSWIFILMKFLKSQL